MSEGLPLAAAAASAHPMTERAVVDWRFPAVPDAIVDATSASWGLTIRRDDDAADPRDLPGFAALLAHARSEQVVRALAGRTNLVLPAATALVIGDGPLAETIAGALAGGGSRVLRAIAAPTARLRAHLAGVRTLAVSDPHPAADLLIATGEGHPPVDPSAQPGVAIDASLDGTGLVAAAGRTVRPFVQRVGEGSWVVAAPDPFTNRSGAPGRIADLLIAASILHARTDDADRALTELVLS